VVPASDISLDYIVNNVETIASQARESADVYAPEEVLLKVIVLVSIIPHAGDWL
jgi:hypothetical protein